jgi:DNA-binding MarR family transcriptional regulator
VTKIEILKPIHIELEAVDELSAAVFRAFIATLRLHRQLMVKTLSGSGGHPGQAICLRLLAAHDDMTQRDLADALHLSRPTVSRMVRSLQREGLVERRPDEADQRLTRVALTAAGRDAERVQRAGTADYVNQTIGTLSAADRRELARLLGLLAVSISQAMAAPPETTAADPAAGDDRRGEDAVR